MKAKYAKYQRVAIKCFACIILACVVNSILVIKYKLYGGKDGGFAIGFPIITIGMSLLFYIFYLMSRFYTHEYEYIRKRHPLIWKKFYGYRPLFWSGFIRGKYDDGTDEKLNQIKSEVKSNQNLMGAAFLSILVLEVFNLILLACYR